MDRDDHISNRDDLYFSARTGAPAMNQRQSQQTVPMTRPAGSKPAAQPARNQNAGGGDAGRIDELELQVIASNAGPY